jgi:hypothetical protein
VEELMTEEEKVNMKINDPFEEQSRQLNQISYINALNTHNWELQQKVMMLNAENERLREALKPFAEKYTVKDDNLPNEHNALTLINVGDLRAARKSLGETDD